MSRFSKKNHKSEDPATKIRSYIRRTAKGHNLSVAEVREILIDISVRDDKELTSKVWEK